MNTKTEKLANNYLWKSEYSEEYKEGYNRIDWKQQANKQRRLERGGWRQYYRKEEHRETMKNTKRYKHGLYKEKRLAIY